MQEPRGACCLLVPVPCPGHECGHSTMEPISSCPPCTQCTLYPTCTTPELSVIGAKSVMLCLCLCVLCLVSENGKSVTRLD